MARLANKTTVSKRVIMTSSTTPFRILFVCLGNICRSPAGENIMNAVVRKAGLADTILCDSAGTMDWHTGKLPDARMRQAAKEHGYDFKGAARQVLTTDLEEFDLVLAMDRSNLADLQLLDTEEAYDEKIRLFGRYCSGDKFPEEVPDPYYGGKEGFHMVIQMVENGCEGILAEYQNND
ncbi:low molecular weight phosphotyrosine protein phosphatase [bacterium]|nr:low molecular weight phosphotyrosine protein phosphatase [bacterium]MDB4632459.1 low molecular weight phosphotyrosine protein phosphatase [bacterium]